MTHKKCHPPVFMTGGMTFFHLFPADLLYAHFLMPANKDPEYPRIIKCCDRYLLPGSRYRIPAVSETLPGSRSIFVDVDFFKGETLGSLCRKLLIWNSQGKDRFEPAL